MSYWMSCKCPNCGRTWWGSIGWDYTPFTTKEELSERMAHLCGCKNNKENQMSKKSKKVIKRIDPKKEMLVVQGVDCAVSKPKESVLKKAWNWLGVHMGFLCPECKSKLKLTGSVWRCSKCGMEYLDFESK